MDGVCTHFGSGFIYIFCELHGGGELQEDQVGSICARNDRLFNNNKVIITEDVANIKAWSWCWFLGNGVSTLVYIMNGCGIR